MTLYSLNPVTDPRWRDFIQSDPRSSIFHTPEWLDALARTYNYEPIAYTTSPSGKEIRSAQVFCDVNSWVTGRRLVSLPFSDHSAPLTENEADFREILAFLQQKVDRKIYKYVEIRPPYSSEIAMEPFGANKSFYWHLLDLKDDLQSIFARFHESCVQRKIRRAERERLDYAEGRSEKLLQQFYVLLIQARRRYGLPPQPLSWFRNLIDCLGSNVKISLAFWNGKPVASIITLNYKNSLIYKYGCSDPAQNKVGGVALLFWKAIQEAKSRGLNEMDWGRTDCSDNGLATYKERWGASRHLLTYSRYPFVTATSEDSWQLKIAKRLFGMVPTPTLATAGKLLYRHVG